MLVYYAATKNIVLWYSIIGIGLYVSGSVGVSSGSVANNTALLRQSSNRVYVYCYSNSTLDRVTLVIPSGAEYSSTSSGYYTIGQLNPSGVWFYTSSRSYYNPPRGLYTCKSSNSEGKIMEMTFGFYTTAIG